MARNHRQSAVSDHTSDWAAREAEIGRIAAAQHNQLTRAQLARAGLSDNGVRHRTRTGRLHRSFRGVYSLGRPHTGTLEHRMAAVLACGEPAALSHAAGAANLGIRESAATLIDVTSPTGAGRGLQGIRAHRSALPPEEVTLVQGIPTTTCSRTLLDLAETLHSEALAKAIDRAEILRIFDLADIERVLARNFGRHGLLPLRALLSALDPRSKQTRSEFERRLLLLVRDAGLPARGQPHTDPGGAHGRTRLPLARGSLGRDIGSPGLPGASSGSARPRSPQRSGRGSQSRSNLRI